MKIHRLLPVVAILFGSIAIADDWSQWMGDKRDGVLARNWHHRRDPKWRPASENGEYLFNTAMVVLPLRTEESSRWDYAEDEGEVLNSPDGAIKLSGKERVLCFSVATGDKLWEHAYDQPYNISYPGGPRCTPTVNESKVYTLGAEGTLHCLAADSGDVLWSKSLPAEYKTKTAIWGYTSHPLIDGDLLYTIAGGKGSVCIALNKHTGEEVWTALSASDHGYNSPTMIAHAGKKQLLIWTPDSLNRPGAQDRQSLLVIAAQTRLQYVDHGTAKAGKLFVRERDRKCFGNDEAG